MPTLHRSWETLRTKLLQSGHPPVQTRKGINYALVVEFEEIKDDSIPILSDHRLQRWIEHRDSGSTSQIQITPPDSPIKSPTNSASSSQVYSVINSPSKPQLESPPKSPLKSATGSQASSPPDSPLESTKSKCPPTPPSRRHALCLSNIDQLIIAEDYSDDYHDSDPDDEIVESVLSKNLKKIRSQPTAPRPPVKPIQQQLFNQRVQQQKTQPEIVPPPSVPKPPEPNWPETRKRLQAKQFSDVFKDLNFFEKQIVSESEARSLVKDTIIECFLADETGTLIDLLNLINKLRFYHEQQDIEFWSQLVQRFKRKLSSHSSIRNYQSERNIENYNRAFQIARGYSQEANLTFTLRYNDLFFWLNYSDQQDQSCSAYDTSQPSVTSFTSTIPNTSVDSEPSLSNSVHEKPVTGNTSSNPPSTPNDKSTAAPKLEVLTPKPLFRRPEPLQILNNFKTDDTKPFVKAEKQENVNPDEERQVTFAKNDRGQPIFMVKKIKRSSVKTSFPQKL